MELGRRVGQIGNQNPLSKILLKLNKMLLNKDKYKNIIVIIF
jgi:hypothetical protein